MKQNPSVLIWEIAGKLREAGSMGTILGQVLQMLTQAAGCEESALWLLNIKDSRLHVVASVGRQDLTGASLDLDKGIPGAVTRGGKIELIADCASDPRFADIKGPIPRNVLSIPLKNQYDCLGCLQMTDRKDSDFTREDVYICSMAASLIAIALGERGASLAETDSKKVLVALRDLSCKQSTDDGALKQLNLNIYEKETLAIVGESGCGSRTLLRLLHLASDRSAVREGRFLAAGRDMLNAGAAAVDEYHRGFVGYVYPDCPLIPTMTVKENIELATKTSLEPLNAAEALFLAGIQDTAKKLPSQLSPKQRQLVGVARALAKKPDLVLAEEPGEHLSAKAASEVLTALVSGVKKLNATLVIVTHNREIAGIADRVLNLKAGRINSVLINREPKAPAELDW